MGSGLFAQDLSEKDQKIVRVEALRPFPGDESMTTNLTSLRHGTKRNRKMLGSGFWEMMAGTLRAEAIPFAASCPCSDHSESWLHLQTSS